MKPNSDNQTIIKPVAKKVYSDLLKLYPEHIGLAVEALEIARREREVILPIWSTVMELFKSLRGEFGTQRAGHILTAIEREHRRQTWATDMAAWRKRGELSPAEAATELGLAVEDIIAIEEGSFTAGPEAMRQVRPALKWIRQELQN